MQLSKETVIKTFSEFATVLGLPAHLSNPEKLSEAMTILHRELSKQYSEEQFATASSIAWQQARRFPVIADFHRGFDAPEVKREVTRPCF